MRGREANLTVPVTSAGASRSSLACPTSQGGRTVAHPPYSTQLEAARQGVVTDAMRFVAQREALEPDLVRAEVARGRMVIPANKLHLGKRLEPMCIGVAG